LPRAPFPRSNQKQGASRTARLVSQTFQKGAPISFLHFPSFRLILGLENASTGIAGDRWAGKKIGAGDEGRTRDFNLGKVALYH
jgi:hypothetical protein